VEAFLVSTGVVALGEIGDKTQLLALMLAARFKRPWPIIFGILAATLGMLIADVPVVLIGKAFASKVPLQAVRIVAAVIFAALAIYTLASNPSTP
jgi:Ca2+/H+ antiporter, TMEM165/GDT1 family